MGFQDSCMVIMIL